MSDELLKELRALKETLAVVSERIAQLERRIPASTPPVASPPVSPAPAKAAPRLPASPKPAAAASRDTLESTIGRYWLNRIGIGSLVLGIVFFILYSFQYLGPVAKLLIGFASAAALLGIGVWLDRRRGWGWYARGLIGGGWAILYFTSYAMHHIAAVRVLPSALADLLLLIAVTAGAVRHALAYRSPVITAFAFLLGFITLSISDITYFTLAASVCLVAALVTVAIRMRWHGLCLFGVLASYVTQVFWIQPQIRMSPIVALPWSTVAEAQFWLTAGFLGLYWVAYTVAIMALDGDDPKRRTLTALLVNAACFVTQCDAALRLVYPDARYLLLLGMGTGYLVLSRLATVRKRPALSSAQLLIGLTLITLAIPDRLSDRWTSVLWTLEVASLVWLGLRNERGTYRLFAVLLAVGVLGRYLFHDAWIVEAVQLAGYAIPWRRFIALVAIGSFSAAAAAYRKETFRNQLRPVEADAFHFYAIAASMVIGHLTWIDANRAWISCLWAVEAAAVILLGWRLKDRGLRFLGILWLFFTSLAALGDLLLFSVWWNAWASASVAGLLYGIGLRYRTAPPGPPYDSERRTHHYAIAAASVLLTATLWREMPKEWLSVALAGEGIALLTAGFLRQDKALRFSGLGVFGVLVLKILFIDLAAAETIYRILSFIVAGLVLMAASLAYAKQAGRAARREKG